MAVAATMAPRSPTHRSSRRDSNFRSPSPSTDRFRAVATPTFDNRRRRSTSISSRSSPKKKLEKPSTDRKTKIQVCVRLRPILPSDAKKSGPTPEQRLSSSKSSRARLSTGASSRPQSFMREASRQSSRTSDMEEVIDTEPAWNIFDNVVSQSSHTDIDRNRNSEYAFDHSFGPNHNNEDIYNSTVKDSVISAMEGYHASVFAYGQTATGKTHTMTGSTKRRGGNGGDDEGIVQLAIRDCFDYIHAQKSETREYLLRVSFMEIYNEVINDLLATPEKRQPLMNTVSTTSLHTSANGMPPTANSASAIRIFESKNEGVVVRGLKEEIVTDPEQVFALLAAGEKRRQTGSTGMNKHSSRSHSIFRLIIESRRRIPRGNTPVKNESRNGLNSEDSIASSTFAPARTSGPVRVSTLSLVDLAGSESVRNTGSTGTRQKEGTYINKSLLTLSHVVYKLADASSKKGNDGRIDTMHIPYRDSKLTRLLQPSLGGNAQICIICNISPLSKHIEESHLTLKFASRAKKIKQHATITEVGDDRTLLENYREEIEELKQQLKEAREAQGNSAASMDDEDVQVLSQAVSNLENLILKTTTTEEKKRKKKRRETLLRMTADQGIPKTISGEADASSHSNSLLNGLVGKDEDNTLLNSLTSLQIDDKSKDDEIKDDQSIGSTSLGDESTLMEGRKLVNELHRIQGLLGGVLAKKGNGTPGPGEHDIFKTPEKKAQDEMEVERLRAQLHEQAVHSSLRKADSTFLQAQLEEKDALLRDISEILEAVEKKQVELEAENERLNTQWKNSMIDLRNKESETMILEELIKKRDNQIQLLQEQLGVASDDEESATEESSVEEGQGSF
ncbi:hypothetical protein CTEN210_07670 [Chaetoceros tenuissimus]|uniref:Kinesin-like protein n=1 Tax=Chaetoceros tenuissimus TaxID=426638 RepID=A0AAD3CV86_9STRA|nr:hypothetical protein CTEN210_07670 [Chaetoceros tenuissimus]